MILQIHSDALYLSVSNARSRLGGLFFLGNKSPEKDELNGSILNVAAVIKKRGRLRSRIRIWRVLSQRPKWRPNVSRNNRVGAPTTPDAPPHRQLHCIQNIEQNHQT
jgi:hypothetical protein